MKKKQNHVPETRELFKSFMVAYPHLTMKLEDDGQDVDLVLWIRAQAGLLFDVHVYLDNVDELGLGVGSFYHATWFPCSDIKKREEYIACVHGIIAGKCRVIEYYRDSPDSCSHADLQMLVDDEWRHVSGWASVVPWLFKRGKQTRELRNL